LADRDAPGRLVVELARRGLEVDLLFNNAGFGTNGAFADLALDRELQMIDVNCRALVALTHAVASGMRARGRGVIIHTASLGGLSPTPYYAVYGGTKAFIVAFSEALGVELRPHGVQVYTLCPGATESEFEVSSGFRGLRPRAAGFESADQVAATAIRALGRRESRVISGRNNRVMACALRFMPRRAALRTAARSMRPQGA
jgi:short-subunit dehydrogenase